ncbi:TlpA family protein disulfide reductase [Streptomyces globosus]|uniref:TlpA family protein disulfide reductase n=1 Tax=Streptomyces globosus TaxID=68209 RepID=A0A344U328_9ACTN|nr:TlpA family protein disulfide reductase [Streptomyces globosus]
MGVVRRPVAAVAAAAVAAAGLALAAAWAPGGGPAEGRGGAGGTGTGAAPAVADPGARPAAPELAGADLDGRQVDLAGLRGQVVVVNVWGSWCAPCRAEADDLERVSRQTRGDGVRFLGINIRDRDREAARSFVRAHGLGFPSLHDPEGALLLRFPPSVLNPQTVPSTLVVDRRGRVAAAIGGSVTEEQLRPLVARVAGEAS